MRTVVVSAVTSAAMAILILAITGSGGWVQRPATQPVETAAPTPTLTLTTVFAFPTPVPATPRDYGPEIEALQRDVAFMRRQLTGLCAEVKQSMRYPAPIC
jgi:hypothetical protein